MTPRERDEGEAGRQPDDAVTGDSSERQPQGAAGALAKVKREPWAASGLDARALQRSIGNRSLASLLRPRQPVAVQRHSIDGAPAWPTWEEDEEEASRGTGVQRLAVQRLGGGIPQVQRWGKGITDLFRRRPPPGAGGGQNQPGGGDATVAASSFAYPAKEVEAGGAAVTPTVTGGMPKGATWSLEGASYGSTIDPGAGTLTPGDQLGTAESKPLRVKMTVNQVSTTAVVELVSSEVWTALRDVETFVGEGPFTATGETRGKNGKWDAAYDPAAKHLSVTVPMRITFVNDDEQPTDTDKVKKRREKDQKAYTDTFVRQVTDRWSGRFRIKNVRSPESVWKKVGPVTVSIAPKLATGTDVSYFNVQVDRGTAQTASVSSAGGQRKANLYKDTLAQKKSAFVEGIRTDEVARLEAIAPAVYVALGGGVQQASKPTLDFLGQYLRGMHRPEMVLEVVGRDAKKSSVAKDRAKQVIDALGGVSPHTTKVRAKVDGTLTTTKELTEVELVPSLRNSRFTVPYDIAPHEFGHMLGLPDEYATDTSVVGTQLSTHSYVKRAIDKKYADENAKVVKDSASVMHSGDDLRIQHYAYFWDILVTLSQQASVPTPQLGDADWKLYE